MGNYSSFSPYALSAYGPTWYGAYAPYYIKATTGLYNFRNNRRFINQPLYYAYPWRYPYYGQYLSFV